MSATFDERVLDYVCGGLDGAELERFEAELTRSAVLRLMVAEAEELLALSAEALPAAAPSADLRLRVLEAAVPTAWGRFVDKIATVWDLSVGEVRRTLARALDPAEWEPGPVPGTSVFHLLGGPATAGADVGLVRFPPGLNFPRHGHGESETYVVLEGVVHDSSGQVEQAGDVVVHAGEEVHSFVAGEEGCLFAITLRGGLDIVG